MISRALLEDLFVRTRERAPWNIDGVCLWGYFFNDHDRSRLLAAAPALEQMGYRFVGILEPTPEDDDQGLLCLHVEREEKHTIESLEARNLELCHFAEEFGLETYDGMDVGPVVSVEIAQIRGRGLKLLLIGGSLFVANAALLIWLSSTTHSAHFPIVGMSLPLAFALIGSIEFTTGSPFQCLADSWMRLQGWQRGALGTFIVFTSLSIIICVVTFLVMMLT
jgi:hypothetical protein